MCLQQSWWHTFTVTDAAGCTYTTTAIPVTAPIFPDITVSHKAAFINCMVMMGAIRTNFNASLGLAFQFSNNGGPFRIQILLGLSAELIS
jgi:hypothetical protein